MVGRIVATAAAKHLTPITLEVSQYFALHLVEAWTDYPRCAPSLEVRLSQGL